jgi:alpha-beta hydrolase superfamily lysophospholipase
MAQASRTASWVNDALARLVAVSGVGYLATAYTISRWLTRASPDAPEIPEDSQAIWQHVACTTADGISLAGWIASPEEPRGTVALFHGMRQSRGQMLGRIEFLLRAGYRCVAFDHRAHGQSGGRRTSFGWHEAHDVAAVARFVAERWPDQPRAALGVSMGAAALCFAAGRAAFDVYVLESLYHDLAAAFRDRVGAGYPSWFGPFVRGVVWLTERRLGVLIDHITPADYIARLGPALLVTGSDDPHASPGAVARLFERCADPREFHLIAGAEHSDVADAGGERYRELVLGFLARHLQTAKCGASGFEN